MSFEFVKYKKKNEKWNGGIEIYWRLICLGEVDYDIVNYIKVVCDKDDVLFCNVNSYLIVRNGEILLILFVFFVSY